MKLNIILFTVFSSVVVQAATYYVSTTGSDSNPGTSTKPWRNPNKCALSPIKAGDICIVRSGTYTDTDLDGITVYIRGSAPAGTTSLPITIKSETPLGATIQVPSSVNAANAAFYVSRSNYIIDGFNITGGTKNFSNGSYAGIVFNSTYANGAIARNNSIHHIGRSVCSNSVYGYSGIFLHGSANVLVEKNQIYSIGRRRNGESGCVTNLFQNDHGIYIAGSANLILRRNVFYDTNRGFPIHFYGGTTTNANVYHNTISGKSPTGKPAGQIKLASNISGMNIKNNISSDASYGMVTFYSLTASKVVVSNNISTGPDRYGSAAGVSFSSNIQNIANMGFVNKLLNNFRLTSTSPARNRGVLIGPSVPDGKPDLGAYEY